jgi:nucleoside-diphosphate-sugar epimerase
MTFQPDDRRGEPHRTNVEGTRKVLEFCRRTGIRKFHHVSTAFICGLRTGRVLETEVDLGQQYGNVYERSKITGEKMVREAEFLDPPTIYRPATIVGDSRSGYTTTYHGVYAPLKLAHAVADKVDMSLSWGGSLMQLLGLSGSERKNLIPVDWVAAAIASIHVRPECHGKTYHLAPGIPVRVAEMTEVMEEALRESTRRRKGRAAAASPEQPQVDLENFAAFFRSQMEVYKSHWRDDPEFDLTNTQAALPHLPSPVVDREMLRRICAFALDVNFGWPKPAPVKPEFDVAAHLAGLLEHGERLSGSNGSHPALGLQVNGPGGGQWELWAEDGRVVAAHEGIGRDCRTRFYLNSRTFQRLAGRRVSAVQAIDAGQVLIEGCGADDRRLADVLQAVATEGHA